ncbi:helix-turn-helix transcriptional regulator [Cohnella hongkongensis]|uniref:Helix-turn-helix transcriptional regulator n=1 Tax=Cohnella hongkongensis TaxID=178337 RepID=A0ABV9FE46_9BACL
MRLNRLLGMTLELMAKRRVTAAELAAKFEVSVRTVYRDVELIGQAGIPVASYTGADGGFELTNGFFLTRQHFSVDDLSVIYALLKAVQSAMGGAAAPAMRKLVSLHPALANDESNRSVILDMSTSERDRDVVHQLYQAIRQSRIVELAYTGASGACTDRSVEPLNLLWEKGVWYLEAYCRMRRAKRYFRISRIRRLRVTEATFSLRSLPEEQEQEYPGIQAYLRFDPSVSERVFEQFPGECSYQGDSVDVRTTFYAEEYALSVVASYGTKVDIVSPEELREAVIAHLEAMRRHHLSKMRRDGT